MRRFLALILWSFVSVAGMAQDQASSLFVDWPDSRYTNRVKRYAWPDQFRGISIDVNAVDLLLKPAPMEFTQPLNQSGVVLAIPLPDGSEASFRMIETQVMHPALAAAYPNIRTYAGQGIEHPEEVLRLSITQHGLHAMVLSPRGDVFIDPVEQGNRIDHIVYLKGEFRSVRPFSCETDDQELYKNLKQKVKSAGAGTMLRTHGTQLRNYRLALAATGEYTAFHGGTRSSALAAMVVSMNRVNGIYEKEVAVRMTLVPNDTLIIYTNGSTDPYTNNNGSTMLGENITTCNSVIGSANYDIGHVFSTGGGGVAYLGVPCTANKAGGVTGSGSPVGDAFDVDYVAHEMGHQFAGQHTFNSATSSCSGNRSAGSAYEPGSGITIMAYAGICGSDNLAPNSIAYFHTHSFDQIVTYITTGNGNSCPTTTATGNTPPVATPAGLAYTIPFQTPFQLTASATDANGDALTYSWEEYDLGAAGAWNAPSGNAPIFRPFPPVTSGVRIFPKLSDILANTTTIGELLPTYARSLFFRVTARDNRVGGGGVMHIDDTVKVTVINTTTPFRVTAPNTAVTWFSGTTATVTWDVSSTNLSPISCANVAIELSTDGGNTFPVTLAATTPNDGSESITVPGNLTTQARVRIRAVGNIFFDISNVNFTIQSGSGILSVLNTDAIATTNLCAGQTLNVAYTGDGSANAGNVYTAQLSSSTGSFTSPVSIGTLTSTASTGTISCTIPIGTAQGAGYRIRVIASNPAVTGNNNGANLSVFRTLGSTGTVTGSATVCQSQTGLVYSTTAVTNATTYAWTLPSGFTITAGSGTNSITVSVSASAASGTITVTPSNPCNTGTASTTYSVTVNPLPAAAGAITGPATPCTGSTGNVYSVSAIANATSYSWTVPTGASITSGSGTTSITASMGTNSGVVSITGTNACGSGAASTLAVAIQSAPSVPVIVVTPSSSACTPDSITLSISPQAGTTYQWRRNGTAISGATGTTYKATLSGSYDVVVAFQSVGAQTFSSTSSVFINDNSCTGAASSIAVSGYSNPVRSSGIFVRINSLTHTWVGDLDLFLESPSGEKLGLSDQTANANNNGDNFTNTVFADSGTAILPTTGAPYTGLYKPWNAVFTVTGCTGVSTGLTTFAALGGGTVNPNGTWKLWAYDRASTDTGRIVSWTIGFPFQSYSCTRTSNPVTLSFQSAPTVSSFTPATGTPGSTVTVSGTNFSNATAVTFNGTPATSFSVVSSSQLTAIVPSGASLGKIAVTNVCGTGLSANNFLPVNSITLQVTALIEGLRVPGGSMTPLLSPTQSDSLTVQLRQAVAPYAVLFSGTGAMNLSGQLSLSVPATLNGSSVYIVVRHRNSLETWSKLPVTLGSVTNYSFK